MRATCITLDPTRWIWPLHPNHNMYVNISKRADSFEGYKLIRMDQIPRTRRFKFKKNANWDGVEIDEFVIPSVRKFKNQNRSRVGPRPHPWF